jgi:type IV secretory pathway VirB2 component (pilin)
MKFEKFVAPLVMAVLLSAAASPAQAASGLNIESMLQNIVDMLSGTTARLLAILAIMLTGIAWMFGYLDLRKAGTVVLGVAIVFGAAQIVSMITGG